MGEDQISFCERSSGHAAGQRWSPPTESTASAPRSLHKGAALAHLRCARSFLWKREDQLRLGVLRANNHGLFARTFNLPNIICAMCDRSRNLARLAAACVCRQIFGGCRVTNRCCGGRRAGWSRVCCPRCVGLLVKKSSSTASTAAGAWASTAGAAVSTGGEKAFRRLFFFVDSWSSWERAFPLCRRCCCRRWMAEGAAARWAGPRPGMTCWREVAVCSHSVASVLFWLAWWGADLPCRILCSTRWRLYCCGEKPTWRQ